MKMYPTAITEVAVEKVFIPGCGYWIPNTLFFNKL
jgi:hypothetical protein